MIEELSEWKQTKHNGLVYEGEDAGCVSLTIWGEGEEYRDLEIWISADDVGLTEAGLRRFATLMLHRVEACIALAQEKTDD